MRVLIVGASGLVGRELVGMLSKKTGGQPVAAVRRPDASYAAAGIETRICDAVSAPSVEQAIAGTSHVVNCVLGPADTMLAATRNVAEASLRHGVARVVHFSSIAVFGTRSGEVGEDAPQGEGADWYGRAKIECETIVRDAGRRGLSSVILRPACVYGPGSDLWTGRIGRLLAARRLGDLGPGGEGTCNLVHVRDVAAAAPDGRVCVAKVDCGIVHLYCRTLGEFARKQKRRVRDFLYFSPVRERAIVPGEHKRIVWGIVRFSLATLGVVPLLLQRRRGARRMPDPAWSLHVRVCFITLWIYSTTFLGKCLGFRQAPLSRDNWRQ
jgi:uncharacterized protein YbjT (DUF2867 family)